MTALPTSKEDVIAAIRSLTARHPRSREEMKALEVESVALALHIQKHTALSDVPEAVWHFLSDADIRFKDPKYADAQLNGFDEVLNAWLSGAPKKVGSHSAPFFNRPHFVLGAQTLASIFCMLGAIFIGIDRRSLGIVRPETFVWLGTGILLSALAAVVSRRARSGVAPLVSGSSIGLLYLGTTWLLAKTGG